MKIGHHATPKCPKSSDGHTMKLLEHELWNHGDVCYDPQHNVTCPEGCTSSKESGSDWLYCDMKWPRLSRYMETDKNTRSMKEKRYPCRVPEGKFVLNTSLILSFMKMATKNSCTRIC